MSGKNWSPKSPKFVPFQNGSVILPKGGKYPEDALVVISVSEDKQAFQASPEHGGLVWNFDLAAIGRYGFRFAQPEELIAVWRKGRFYLEMLEGSFEGWTTGELWNGWATPAFEKKVAERLMKALTESKLEYGTDAEHAGWKYDKTADAFLYYDYEGTEPIVEKGLLINAGGKPRAVYGIGSGAWTWSEED